MKEKTIPIPGNLPQRPLLSVCMIVRDEEQVLARCLKSVQGVADELIVVDTGSTDGTVAIAEKFGAKIFHFEWCDDFSAARNESLRHATGHWILQMDADEELKKASLSPLRKAMGHPRCLCYLVRCDSRPAKDSKRFGNLERFAHTYWIPRLFRNHPGIYYTRAYHEMVKESVDAVVVEESKWKIVQKQSITIRHFGYELSEEEWEKKSLRGLRIMTSYIESNPDDAYILDKIASLHNRLGQYDEAISRSRQALDIEVENADFHYNLAFSYQMKGMLDEAVKAYEKALKLDDNLVDAHYNLAMVYEKKELTAKAIVGYKKAVSLDPDFFDAHAELGFLYHKEGRFLEAVSALKKAVDGKSGDDGLHAMLGRAYEMTQMSAEAVKAYKKALKIAPDNAMYHYNLGAVYTQMGRASRAIAEYKQAIAINPDLAEAHNNLAVAYFFQKEYNLAAIHCDRAIKLGFAVHPQFLKDLQAHGNKR